MAIARRRLSSSFNLRGWPSSEAFRAAFDRRSLVSSQWSWVPNVCVAKSENSKVPHVGHVYRHDELLRGTARAADRHNGQTASGIWFPSRPYMFGWRSSEEKCHPSCRGTYRGLSARSASHSPWALLCDQSPIVGLIEGARRFIPDLRPVWARIRL